MKKFDEYNNLFTQAERKNLIAETLKILRKGKRLTQQDVAEKLDIQTQTYATYERGRNEPPAEILVRLSYLYDVPVDIIIQRDNFGKDKESIKNEIKAFDDALEEMRSKVLSGDPQMREQLSQLTDALGKFTEAIGKATDKM